MCNIGYSEQKILGLYSKNMLLILVKVCVRAYVGGHMWYPQMLCMLLLPYKYLAQLSVR
jgi:hypothetical protein